MEVLKVVLVYASVSFQKATLLLMYCDVPRVNDVVVNQLAILCVVSVMW